MSPADDQPLSPGEDAPVSPAAPGAEDGAAVDAAPVDDAAATPAVADTADLTEVEGVGDARARAIKEGLSRLAETSILERYV